MRGLSFLPLLNESLLVGKQISPPSLQPIIHILLFNLIQKLNLEIGIMTGVEFVFVLGVKGVEFYGERVGPWEYILIYRGKGHLS